MTRLPSCDVLETLLPYNRIIGITGAQSSKDVSLDNKLYVGNLSSDTTEEELETFFSSYGTVVSVKIKRDNVTSEPWGYGFVEMADPSTAEQALLDAKWKMLRNNRLSIDPMRIP